MRITRRKAFWPLAIGSVAALCVWRHFKTDEFFPNLGLHVPQSAIVSHKTDWWLTSEEHQMVLQIPAAAWPALRTRFQGANRFRDITPNLRAHYGEFAQGREAFYPPRITPENASAGEFMIKGRDGYEWFCHYLRDATTGRVWFVGLSFDN